MLRRGRAYALLLGFLFVAITVAVPVFARERCPGVEQRLDTRLDLGCAEIRLPLVSSVRYSWCSHGYSRNINRTAHRRELLHVRSVTEIIPEKSGYERRRKNQPSRVTIRRRTSREGFRSEFYPLPGWAGSPSTWEPFQRFFFRTITLDCSCRSRFTARRCSRVDEGFFSDFPRDLSATVAPFSEVPSDRPRPYVRKNKKPVRWDHCRRTPRPPDSQRHRPARGRHVTRRQRPGIERCVWEGTARRGAAVRGPSPIPVPCRTRTRSARGRHRVRAPGR